MMKTWKLLLIAVILFTMLGMQGCAKTWFVDFTKVSNINNWLLSSNYEIVPGIGLVLANSNNVTAPFLLTGDFSITVSFKLATTSAQRVLGAIWLGSIPNYPHSQSIISFYYEYGGISNPYFELWTDGPTTDTDIMRTSNVEIPGMVNNAINTYTIVKVGSSFESRLNGVLLWSWFNTRYESDNFYLTLNSSWLTDNQVIYKSVKIEADSSNMTPAAMSLGAGITSGFGDGNCPI